MANVWVFVQETDGQPSTLGLELLTKARSLGDVDRDSRGRRIRNGGGHSR